MVENRFGRWMRFGPEGLADMARTGLLRSVKCKARGQVERERESYLSMGDRFGTCGHDEKTCSEKGEARTEAESSWRCGFVHK